MKMLRSMERIAFTASSAIILYALFAVVAYTLGTGVDKDCMKARATSAGNKGGILAEAMSRYCAVIGLPNEKRLGLHLSDDSGDSVLVFYEPRNDRDAPVLRWLDADHLSVDLGEAKWLTPQIDHLGRVKISYTYSGAEPSLE